MCWSMTVLATTIATIEMVARSYSSGARAMAWAIQRLPNDNAKYSKSQIEFHSQRRAMVSLHGHTRLSSARVTTSTNANIKINTLTERPPDPTSLLTQKEQEERTAKLLDWLQDKKSVLCLTGAGLSTESGIRDYRGANGAYHEGHKPMIHQRFMDSEYQRKRYWGRSLVGWQKFYETKPNKGHAALARMEKVGWLGVAFEDDERFYDPMYADEFAFTSGQRNVAIVTQNVDSLHQRAGSKHVLQIHGAGNVVKCMECGHNRDRNGYQQELEDANREWLLSALKEYKGPIDLRPDGDAKVQTEDYHDVHVPNCPRCGSGFFKPDVVFFGDTVPKHRVDLCRSAVNAADSILVVGSSLAVHSAYRHVRAASQAGKPIAILNVGETRAELEKLDHLLKIEAPAGDTLAACAEALADTSRRDSLGTIY